MPGETGVPTPEARMYIPTAFRETDRSLIQDTIRDGRLASLVTATAAGLVCTPLPMLLDADEGPLGTLYGHVAKANPHWMAAPIGAALAIFMGPDAYITPSWYDRKRRDGKVVPTWNYMAVHAHGPVEFFEDAGRLLDIVTRLTDRHEAHRTCPWAVGDAPAEFIRAQLGAIVGVRLPIARLEAKRKMSQNHTAQDRATVKAGLAHSDDARDQRAAALIPD